MKTVLMSTVFFVVLTISGFAQLEKGTWIGGINGSLGFSGNSSYYHSIRWSFNPYGMYLIRKNLAVGIELNNKFRYDNHSYNDGTSNAFSYEGKSYTFQLAPTVRKYFGNGRFRPYVGLSTGLVLYNYNYNYSDQVYNHTGTRFGYFIAPQVGASWWINSKVYLDMNASFNFILSKNLPSLVDLKIGAGFKIGK